MYYLKRKFWQYFWPCTLVPLRGSQKFTLSEVEVSKDSDLMLLGCFKWSVYLRRAVLIIFLALTFSGWGVESAQAMLRQHHDSPGVLRYHSQVSIKDELGYAWQVLLFKQNYNNAVKDLRLRLVGFPGVVEIVHPQPLEIETEGGKLLLASDAYALTAPAPNVGEYELTDVLPKLSTTDALKLRVPAYNGQSLILNIPNNVVTEWQWLVTDID